MEAEVPIIHQEVVVKIHRRCNINCDYCYMYRQADPVALSGLQVMSMDTMRQVAMRLGEYAAAHALAKLAVILHGGEPLLVGAERLGQYIRVLKAAMPAGTQLDLRVQTNATQLNPVMLEMLLKHDVRVGVSLDGGREANDRHRLFDDGRSSYNLTMQGLEQLLQPRYRHLFAGILAVIDLANDPVETYESLIAFAPPAIDFLLPHNNWTNPPPGLPPQRLAAGPPSQPPASVSPLAPYGDWLVAVFNRWVEAPHKETEVRFLYEIVRIMTGGHSGLEGIGTDQRMALVIGTDGEIERLDSLRSTFVGAVKTGLTVFSHPLEAASGPGWDVPPPSPVCLACPIYKVCGGGLHVHRYWQPTGFANPSVYCNDLARLIMHIHQRLAAMV
jgi:uncharacterized protein